MAALSSYVMGTGYFSKLLGRIEKLGAEMESAQSAPNPAKVQEMNSLQSSFMKAYQFDFVLLEQNRLILNLLQAAADLSISAPESFSLNSEATLDVTITNSGAGHSLSTGPLDQRHMWLEVKVTDAAGKVIYHSGWFDDKTGQMQSSI